MNGVEISGLVIMGVGAAVFIGAILLSREADDPWEFAGGCVVILLSLVILWFGAIWFLSGMAEGT